MLMVICSSSLGTLILVLDNTQVVVSHGTMTITYNDEGDIFEDDKEEDEGYLFAGQGICTKYRIPF